MKAGTNKPDYGVDAPAVMRNFFLVGGALLFVYLFLPRVMHFGSVAVSRQSLLWMGGFFVLEGLLFLLYVKVIKFYQRDKILGFISWRGDERVLDVGCGRGLLLVGAARRLSSGKAIGIDVWSNEDMGGNSAAATERNIEIEGVGDRCEIVSVPAQQMTFPDGYFDVIVSNLCLHNIYDKPTRTEALEQIVRVLAPGGAAVISDYKLTGEYKKFFTRAGLQVERRWGSPLAFPPLRIVVARKRVGHE